MSLHKLWLVAEKGYMAPTYILLISCLSILLPVLHTGQVHAKSNARFATTLMVSNATIAPEIDTGEIGTGDEPSPSATSALPTFSHTGGFYTGPFQLELSTQEAGASIHYTLDGSEPTATASRYQTPISVDSRTGDPNVLSLIRTTIPGVMWVEPNGEVFKATTIRARVIPGNGSAGPIVTHTYFVDPAGVGRYSLPVISLVTDADNFFDPEIGIYVPGSSDDETPNYEQSGRDWERPVHIELFENGTRILAQDAGVRTHGGNTRIYQSKSLRFYARSDYGPSTFEAQLFPDRPFTDYTTFILRNAGNDWGLAHFRDGLIHRMVEPLTLDIQAFRPVIVFLNGEYWGILDMRERQDADYLQTHYGIPTDAVDMLELPNEVSEGSDDHYWAMIDSVELHGVESADRYAALQTQMDIDNFIDYNIVEMFSSNTDWPHNNVENWRYQSNFNADAPYGFDGRWRWFIKDLDFGFGGFSRSGNYQRDMLVWATAAEGDDENAWATLLLRALFENETFRHKFINRFADLLNTLFVSARVQSLADEIAASLAPELPEQIRRYQRPASMDTWQNEVQIIEEFIQQRPQFQRQHIVDFFDLGGVAPVNLDVSSVDAGHIRINSLAIEGKTIGLTGAPYPWQGIYFQDVPVEITAVPHFGYRFVGWDGLANEELANELSVELLLTGELNLTARFEATADITTSYLPQVAR